MSDRTQKTPSERNEEKSRLFQRQFDAVLLTLLAVGLVVALFYGASAGICSTDPQRSSAMVSASSETTTGAPAASATAGKATVSAGHRVIPAATQFECNPSSSSSSWPLGLLLALSIALAALALGAFVGFLFGLPRSLTSSDFRAAAQAKATAQDTVHAAAHETSETSAPDGGETAVKQASEVNTNLEKISDWLTTIIVGVGLTKLQDIPGGIEEFGNRVAPYFGYGGKVFGIAAGLYFLIGGFFLAYVGTRVRLSLIFLWSQLTNFDATETQSRATRTAFRADPFQTSASGPVSEDVKKADEVLLSKSLSELKTADEVVAWANAKARAGDYASALAGYRDVVGRVPVTQQLQTNYAQVLAATGDTAGANNVIASLATTGISPEAEQEARLKVAAAAQAGQVGSLRTRLQQNLYKPVTERGFEDSIVAGEQLLAGPDAPQDAWVHVWLASAYGQKHAAEKAAAGPSPTAEQKQVLDDLRSRAVEHVQKALSIDPAVKPILRGLYDPGYRVGNDDDLDSLRPDEALDALFLE